MPMNNMPTPNELEPGEHVLLLVQNKTTGQYEKQAVADDTDVVSVDAEARRLANIGANVKAIVSDDPWVYKFGLRPYEVEDSLLYQYELCICNDPACPRSKALWN